MSESLAALAGLRVLDASSDVAGQFCGRLLADYGAEVILAEPAEGAATRREGPFEAGGDEPGRSLLFEHLNQGKSGHRLPRDPTQAAAEFERLAREADVILTDDLSSPLRALDDGGRIVCTLSEFGEIGPYRDWRGGELVQQALSGVMLMTGRGDREPLYGVGRRAAYATGATAYIACLAALIWRDRTGQGQAVEAVAAEASAAMAQNLLTQYSYTQSYPSRRQYPGMLGQLKCKDGWLILFALRGWPAICRIFGVPEAATDPRFRDPVGLRRNWPAAEALLAERAPELLVDDLVAQLQQSKISSARVLTLLDVLAAEQFDARRFLRRDAAGRLHSLGPVFRTRSPCRPLADAPSESARSEGWRSRPRVAASELPPPSQRDGLPLQGLRVIDFTQAWAGPMAARALAFLGADVVKVENGARMDAWRGPAGGMGDPASYPGRQAGERPYDRNALFNTQNHDKRSLSLNLKDPAGADLARRLATTADVVLANFSPRALDRLGLSYAALSRDNPGLVMVEMPAFGNDGPWAAHVGMGKTMEAAAGMASLIGYGDGVPVLTGPAYLDPIGGLHGAAAVLTALAERNVTGRGQYVEVAQVEAAMHWIGEYVLATGRDGAVFEPQGNQRPDMAPHDAFPCQGEDAWVALAAPDEATWRRLAVRVGLDPERHPSLAARQIARDEIGRAITAWTLQRSKVEAADQLQAAGVPAAPVSTGGDVHRDPALRQRGFVHTLSHPAAGVADYPGLAYRLARTPGAIRRGAPCFAEHTFEILFERLGLDAEAVEALVRAGVVLLEPTALRASAPASALATARSPEAQPA